MKLCEAYKNKLRQISGSLSGDTTSPLSVWGSRNGALGVFPRKGSSTTSFEPPGAVFQCCSRKPASSASRLGSVTFSLSFSEVPQWLQRKGLRRTVILKRGLDRYCDHGAPVMRFGVLERRRSCSTSAKYQYALSSHSCSYAAFSSAAHSSFQDTPCQSTFTPGGNILSFVDLDTINTVPLIYQLSDNFNRRAQCKNAKPLKLNILPPLESADVAKHHQFDLCNLRRESKLYMIPIYSVLRTLVDDFPDLHFRREGFVNSLQKLLLNEGWNDVSAGTLSTVFDAFDRNQNDIVDFIELLAGLAQVCQGTHDERIRAIFETFDREQDGRLHFDEVMGVFCLIYRATLSLNMVVDLKQAGIEFDTIDELSLSSTQELFRQILYKREKLADGATQAWDLERATLLGSAEEDPESVYGLHEEDCARMYFNEKLLSNGEDKHACNVDTIDLEANGPRRHDTPADAKAEQHRIHPALEFNRNEGVHPWRIANAMRHLYITYDDFKNACLKTPPAAGFSKSTLLRLPLILMLKEILAPPEPLLWNCPVTFSRQRLNRNGRSASAGRGAALNYDIALNDAHNSPGALGLLRQSTLGAGPVRTNRRSDGSDARINGRKSDRTPKDGGVDKVDDASQVFSARRCSSQTPRRIENDSLCVYSTTSPVLYIGYNFTAGFGASPRYYSSHGSVFCAKMEYFSAAGTLLLEPKSPQ